MFPGNMCPDVNAALDLTFLLSVSCSGLTVGMNIARYCYLYHYELIQLSLEETVTTDSAEADPVWD